MFALLVSSCWLITPWRLVATITIRAFPHDRSQPNAYPLLTFYRPPIKKPADSGCEVDTEVNRPYGWAAAFLLFSILGSFTLNGCSLVDGISNSKDRAQDSAKIRIDGSSTVYPISALMSNELFIRQHPDARVVVGYSGTGSGMKKFIGGEIDICDASRSIKNPEIEACRASGVDFLEFQIAYDGIAVVVSAENNWCDCLTVEQLKRIWTPDQPVRKWSDLNADWPEEELVLYGPGVESGTFYYFTKEILHVPNKSRADYSPSEDDNILVAGVSSSKYALGYFGLAFYEKNKEHLKLLGVDSGDGCIKPTLKTVSTTYHPLSRPLFIYVRKSSLANQQTLTFVDFYLRNAAEVVQTVGYVPVEDSVLRSNLEVLAEYRTHQSQSAVEHFDSHTVSGNRTETGKVSVVD